MSSTTPCKVPGVAVAVAVAGAASPSAPMKPKMFGEREGDSLGSFSVVAEEDEGEIEAGAGEGDGVRSSSGVVAIIGVDFDDVVCGVDTGVSPSLVLKSSFSSS